MEALDDWSPPEEFDGYRLGRLLGRGAMGQVYLAHDTVLDRPVAIKFIAASTATDNARERFFVEARAIARLQHPNVVSIYRVGVVDGCPYLVSEFIRGKGLDRLDTPVAWREALRIGLDLARGLAAAHRRGVVHRDIKPANAILSIDGEVKLLDFGLAKLLEPDATRAVSDSLGPASSELRISPRIESVQVPKAKPLPVFLDPESPHDLLDASTLASTLEEGSLELTQPGTLVGTPLYMAPELWRGEPASFASDVYSLGALLYKLCSGRPPHVEAGFIPFQPELLGDAAPLASIVPDVDAAFAAVVDRCLKHDPAQRWASGNEVRAALAQLTPEVRAQIVPGGNPYRGLRAFEAEHRALYFGRDSEIRTLLDRLSGEPFVVVTGDSGVGKSSLCRAGVLPRVAEWLDKRRAWTTVTFVPGKHPLVATCAALATHLGASEEDVATRLREDPSAVGRELRRAFGDDRGLVLFLDQLEELVTLSDPKEAQIVAELLGWLAAPSPGLRVLATVRGDFLSRLAVLQPIGDAISRAIYFLRPLSAERMREAIVGPASAKGVTFESEQLVDELVDAAVRAEGALPLLQFALAELWEARDRKTSTISKEALDRVGGVAGALGRHGDDVLAKMLPPHREAARRVLLRLVTAEGTRARRSAPELTSGDAGAEAALDELVRGRLVVAREAPDGAGYEIAHEALIHGWATFARWLSADESRRIVRERITTAVREWQRLGRAREALFSARQLDEAASVPREELAPEERAFLDASRRAHRRARALRVAATAVVPLAVLAAWGGLQLRARGELRKRVNEEVAAAQGVLADARAIARDVDVLKAQAFAKFDAMERDEAEKLWARALDRDEELRTLSGRATQRLETAVLLDRSRADVQAMLADALYERALLAESRGATSEKEELLQRLALYDPMGERSRRWSAPASVSFGVDPSPESATLERYVEEQHRLRLAPASTPVLTGTAMTLAPGSYLLTLQTKNGPVRYPFAVARGEQARFDIDLRPASDVPRGFVYVPAGRFWFGSTAEDSVRRGFFHAAPIHRARTNGYFVAAHETTFGDWLAYLRALPEAERAPRLPRVEAGGFSGTLTFKELPPDGFQLTFQPATQAYSARVGERVTYVGRARRISQDWLKFPVFGVGVDDARAYAAWLARDGGVPFARLCTELEWERAARGADQREYPHGGVLAPDDADYDETYAKVPSAMGPDEVGAHPVSRSPFDLDDMAGNVWEWADSALVKGGIVARGGSYYFDVNSARVSNREEPEPSFRDVSVGFRVCADLRPR